MFYDASLTGRDANTMNDPEHKRLMLYIAEAYGRLAEPL